MKKMIFKTWDSNMARQEWRWVFSLKRCADGTFTLSGEQIPVEPEESDEPFLIAPVSSLQRGTDIYEEFQVMLSEAGGDIHDEDLDAIADEIAELDPKVADHFRRAEDLLLHRAQRSRRRERAEKDAIQMRFADAIADRCAGLDDTPGQVGGRSISSPKDRAWRYLESHLERIGQLPNDTRASDPVPTSGRNARSLDAVEGWIKLNYQRTSHSNGVGGICPYCGSKFYMVPGYCRWKKHCQCGAWLDYLGVAWLQDG
jgi:hypothetical protein